MLALWGLLVAFQSGQRWSCERVRYWESIAVRLHIIGGAALREHAAISEAELRELSIAEEESTTLITIPVPRKCHAIGGTLVEKLWTVKRDCSERSDRVGGTVLREKYWDGAMPGWPNAWDANYQWESILLCSHRIQNPSSNLCTTRFSYNKITMTRWSLSMQCWFTTTSGIVYCFYIHLWTWTWFLWETVP